MTSAMACRLVLFVSLAMLSGACPASRPMSVPPGEAAIIADTQAGAGQAAAEKLPEPSGGLRVDGAACFSSSQCVNNVCEGASCDSSRPGSCVPLDRPCTADAVEYCGCDGRTFVASSSCPGEAFLKRGPCDDDPGGTEIDEAEEDPAAMPDGEDL